MTSKTTLKTFKLFSAFVLALTLSACATSRSGDMQYPMDKVTSAIGSAGSRVWTGTRELFRLRDRSAAEQPDEFLDEVDLALLEDGEYNEELQDDLATERLAIPSATTAAEILTDSTAQDAPIDILVGNEPVDVKVESDLQPVANYNDLDNEDLFHTVGENETLWELAKLLTGNATNWTILASVNDLDENGTVYSGQKIRVPAALKRLPVDGQPAPDNLADNSNTPAPKGSDSSPVVQAKAIEAATDPAESFTVEAGETLWDLAKRSTGNANNWKTIAAFNDLDERAASSIRYGQSIKVPGTLLKGAAPQATPALAAAKKPLDQPAKKATADVVAKVVAPKNQPKPDQVADNKAMATEATVVAAGTDESKPKLVTVDANFKSDPPAIVTPKAETKLAEDSRKKRDEIMVSGTYYPKAIYNDANFSSSLLMRVSPGTKLKVSRAVGPWYEVVTDRGVGFVHSRDTK